jgi:ribonuclease BN (tRNA processing enzyme)
MADGISSGGMILFRGIMIICTMGDGIIVKVLGDHGPFSRMGKSIGYQITIGQSNYLIDCGAPLFQHIGGHGLKNIKGLVVTHCHDDHKRWYSDLALFNKYAADISQLQRVVLLTEAVNEELMRASARRWIEFVS